MSRPVILLSVVCLSFPGLPDPSARAQDQSDQEKTFDAPAFDGNFLGMDVKSERLGVILDISESMNPSLPAVREALRKQLPKTPVVHVDGCKLEKPVPRAKMIRGVAPETVTGVDLLGKHAKVDVVLWICDLGDSPNTKGVEAMAETLSEHGIRLYLMSLRNRPGPSLRKLVEESEGAWKIVPTTRRPG